MALRGTASKASTAASGSIVLDVSGIGIQSGDLVVLCYESGGGGSLTLNFPSGFASISGLTNHSNGGSSTSTGGIAYKIASSEPSTYTCSATSVSDFMSLQCRVYSGRSGTFTATAQTSAVAAASPVTYSITGITAAANDDVVLFITGSQNTSASANTYTFTPPSGFANAVLTYGSSTQFSPVLAGCDLVNTSGATGTLGGTMSNSRSQNYGYTAYLMALAIGPTSPIGMQCL